MSADLFRVYLDPMEIGDDGYPHAWHGRKVMGDVVEVAIKDLVRAIAGHRCVRCHHPFVVGSTPGEWSMCDAACTHTGPRRMGTPVGWQLVEEQFTNAEVWDAYNFAIEAQWRVLTVHHLNGVKHDCRWWNLVALCQRCHLTIQGKVHMQRPYRREHSEWFKPYVAAFYAFDKLGEELTRDETTARLDELLALEDVQGSLL